MIVYLFVVAICLCLILFALFTLVQNLFGIPPYMPSFNKHIKAALADIYHQKYKAAKDSPLKFIDLGSGDGKIVFTAAKLGYQAHGIDINPFLYLICKIRSLFWRQQEGKTQRPQFKLGSYFDEKLDLSEYDVIFTYLFPHTMAAMEERIFSNLKPGAVVISNTFTFKTHKPSNKFKYKNIKVYQAK